MFFVKRGASLGNAQIIVLLWYLQCLVAIGLFTKKQTNQKIVVKMGMFFERAVGTTCSSILVDFGLHFGMVLGAQIGKNMFRRGLKKRLKQKIMRVTQKVTQVSAPCSKPGGSGGEGSLTSIHPGVPRPPSGAPEHRRPESNTL